LRRATGPVAVHRFNVIQNFITSMEPTPDVPRHVHTVSSIGQITIPAAIREEFDTDEFVVFTDPEGKGKQIHLHPVRTR
jgi:AbrB family looped-hinge helix DNA binding protein